MAGKKFSIQAVISMVDRASGPMGKVNKSVNRLNKGINKVGGRAAKAGMTGLGVGAAVVARQFVQFDDAIFAATARFKASEKPGTDMAKVMITLRKEARKMGATTQFSATLMAQGLDKFALAGFNSKEAISVLKSQVDLATVTGEDFMEVADKSSDLLGGFGGNALSSAAKVEKLKEMNALLAVATLSANVTMTDMFETLKTVAPIATIAGKSMKDTIATVSVLGSAGIKGSMAATAMKNIFLNLSTGGKKVTSALAKVGVKYKDLIDDTGKLKETTVIFGMIGNGMKKLSKVKQTNVFNALFGKLGIAGGAVIAQNINNIREQMIKMGQDPQKVMEQTAAFMRQSMGNRIRALGSAFTELGFKIFSAFAGDGKKGLDKMTKGILEFDVTPIISSLKVMLSVVKVLFTILSPFLPIITGIVIAVKAWTMAAAVFNAVMAVKIALTGSSTVAMIASTVAQWAMIAGTTAWSVAAGIATGATTAFGVAIAIVTGPIGLIIAAIAGLVALGKLVYDNWEPIKAFFVDLWGGIKDAFWGAIGWISEKFSAFVDFFSSKAKAIKEFFGFGEDAKAGVDLNKNISGTVDQNLVMPQGGNTTGNVNINVTGSKENASVASSGTMPENTQLNLGLQ